MTSDMRIGCPYQFTSNPYGSSGLSRICFAAQTYMGSSIWSAFPVKGRMVRAVSPAKKSRRNQRRPARNASADEVMEGDGLSGLAPGPLARLGLAFAIMV